MFGFLANKRKPDQRPKMSLATAETIAQCLVDFLNSAISKKSLLVRETGDIKFNWHQSQFVPNAPETLVGVGPKSKAGAVIQGDKAKFFFTGARLNPNEAGKIIKYIDQSNLKINSESKESRFSFSVCSETKVHNPIHVRLSEELGDMLFASKETPGVSVVVEANFNKNTNKETKKISETEPLSLVADEQVLGKQPDNQSDFDVIQAYKIVKALFVSIASKSTFLGSLHSIPGLAPIITLENGIESGMDHARQVSVALDQYKAIVEFDGVNHGVVRLSVVESVFEHCCVVPLPRNFEKTPWGDDTIIGAIPFSPTQKLNVSCINRMIDPFKTGTKRQGTILFMWMEEEEEK